MTTATFILQLFSVIPLITFTLCFIYFIGESLPREGYAPDPSDGVFKSVVTKILTAELVMFILLIPVAIKPPAVSNLNLIDAGHADMTSYWVATVVVMLLTPLLVPPIYWGLYWILAGVHWLLKTLYAALTGFTEWWGRLFFKSKK